MPREPPSMHNTPTPAVGGRTLDSIPLVFCLPNTTAQLSLTQCLHSKLYQPCTYTCSSSANLLLYLRLALMPPLPCSASLSFFGALSPNSRRARGIDVGVFETVQRGSCQSVSAVTKEGHGALTVAVGQVHLAGIG
ncbi:hypothetical protein M3J09_013879 [Ascochyta lentis]